MLENKSKPVPNSIEIVDYCNGEQKVYTFKHYGELKPIEEIDASQYDHEHFLSNYKRNNKPLVIRNALGTFDVGTSYQNWSLEYLSKKCGQNKVHVRRNTIAEAYKVGQAYFAEETTFQSYVDDLLAENEVSKNSYLAVQNLRKAFPQIFEELKPAPFVQKLHGGPFLWIARAGHYEYCHMDPDDNVLSVYKGRKLVRLYGCNTHSMKPNKLGSNGRTIQSQIDCDLNNLDNLTQDELESFKANTCQYCCLGDGDLLYFPAFWWHQVTTPVLTISVNFFFGDGGDCNFTETILRSPQRDAFLYWFFNIISQNAPFPSFSRMLVYLKRSIKFFLFKQWHDVLTNEQAEDIYKCTIRYFGYEELVERLKEQYRDKAEPKNPPNIRIRGLLMREKTDEEEDECGC